MPIRKATLEELEYFRQQGVDVDQIKDKDLEFDNKFSVPQAVTHTARTHAGSILGGGLGVGAGIALAPESLGLSLLIPAITGLAGSYGGQKLQEKIEGPEKTAQLQSEQAQAEQEHPVATTATDVIASALASGGAPKPSNLIKATRALLPREALSAADEAAFQQMGREGISAAGNRAIDSAIENQQALKSVALGGVVNPAINTGLQLATTGELPSGKELIASAAGGALFSGQNPLGRMYASGHAPTVEPKVNGEINIKNQPTELTESISPFNQKNEQGQYTMDRTTINQAFKDLNPKPDISKMNDEQSYVAQAQWRNKLNISDMEKRNILHQNYIQKQDETTTPEAIAAKNEADAQTKQASEMADNIRSKIATTEENKEALPIRLSNEDVLSKEKGMVQKGISNVEKGIKNQKLEEEIQKNEANDLANKIAQTTIQPTEKSIVPPEATPKIQAPDLTEQINKAKEIQEANDPVKQFEKQFGWTAKNGQQAAAVGIPTEAQLAKMSPAEVEMYKKLSASQGGGQTEFTDNRKDSPTKGVTFYAPKNATLEEIKASHLAKLNQANEGKNKVAAEGFKETMGQIGHTGYNKEERLQYETSPSIGGKPADIFRSTLDRIRQINHPMAKTVADAGQRMLDERGQLMGKWWYPTAKYRDEINKAGDRRLEAAQRYELENQKDAPLSMFKTKEEKEAWTNYKEALKDNYNYRVANQEPVIQNGSARMPVRDEHYHPTTLNNNIAEDYKNGRNVAAHDKTFLDYQTKKMGVEPEVAQDNLRSFKESLQGNIGAKGSSLQEYNAARKAQGIALPPEFTKPGFFRNLESYWNRMTLDNSFYKHIESNHDILSALGEKSDAWNNPVPPNPNDNLANNNSVRAFLDSIRGEYHRGMEFTEGALSSVATAGILGPGTEVHKIISNQIGAIHYIDDPYQMSRFLGAAVKNYQQGLEHAYENGIIKIPSTKLGDLLDGQLTAAEKIRTLGNAVRSVYTLNDLTTKFSIGSMQAGLESIFPSKIQRANAGDFNQQKLLKQLDPDYRVGKTYEGQALSQLVSKAINEITGTGDARTMPAWMLHDSEISGFMRLSHWSVAQTNRFFKQIWEPATRGQYEPLVKSMFGSLIGGYVIKTLREELQGKKGSIPSLSELQASSRGLEGNSGLLAYNAMAAATYAGFGGMLSMIAKAPLDLIYKNKPMGMVFPLDEFATDLLATAGHAGTAIANDPSLNWGRLAEAVTKHLISNTFQLGRVVYNQGVNNGIFTGTEAEKKLLNDKLGQLRRFNMVEGIPYSEQDISGNPFMNLEQKSFKMEQDPAKAAQQVMPLITDLINAYHDNPDVMMSKINSLKQNSYSTFPSMETTPLSFLKYLSFIGKKESPQAATEALVDYMRHKIINQAKSSVIP